MNREFRPERVSLPPSPQLSRTQSRASDRDRTPSISGNSFAPLPQIVPEPAYVNASAAAHIINNYLTAEASDVEIETGAAISPSALSLINGFLDQLLFSFLSSSKSTSIISLKPGISEILKPRLAKEAIDSADRELRGYLGEDGDEESLEFQNGQELRGGSNLQQVFRRTRLRCMVYTRLGDMEEAEEEKHLAGGSPQGDERRRWSRDLGNMSPAAEIFLTSVVEFMAEQTLMIAGGNAVNRNLPRNVGDGLLVEDRDVEKVAFNAALGRLWRAWKKRGKVSSMISPRPLSHDWQGHRKNVGERASRSASISEHGEDGYFGTDPLNKSLPTRAPQQDQVSESSMLPKATNLPEEPDFSIGSETSPAKKSDRNRSRSMTEISYPIHRGIPGTTLQRNDNSQRKASTSSRRPSQLHQRSSSLPTIRTTPYSSPTDEAFTTPSEGPDPLVDSVKEREDAEKEMPKLTDASNTIIGTSEGDAGVSTIYDGVLKRQSKPLPIDPSLTSRELSMSEYSDQVSLRNEADMTPQALNFKKPAPKASKGSIDEQSRVSTLSSNYSFQGGQQSPLLSSEDLPATAGAKEDDEESIVFPTRGKSLDQTRAEPGNFEKLATTQGDELNAYDESEKAVKRDIPVYEGASDEDVVYEPQGSQKFHEDEEVLPTSTIINSKDIAHAGYIHYGDLPPSDIGQDRSSMAATQVVDMRRSNEIASPGVERAAVQRVVSPSVSYTGRTSTSSVRDGRPATAGSSGSHVSPNIRGIMSRDSGDMIRPSMPGKSSSEVRREMVHGTLRSGVSSDKKHDFEQLIRSDETIQYTLTPQNMRKIEVSSVVVVSSS